MGLYVLTTDGWRPCRFSLSNVYLYATSKGITTVVRGMIDTEKLTSEHLLPDARRPDYHRPPSRRLRQLSKTLPQNK